MATTQVEVKKAAGGRNASVQPWRSLRAEMDRLFDHFAKGFGPSMFEPFSDEGAEIAVPAVDFAESDKAFTVTAELPGIEEKDIDVTVSGGMLTIKGEKKKETEEKDKNYYLSERSYGSFQRSFSLPEGIDQAKIAANFAKGVLTVTLPKSADALKPQKIDVKAA